MTAKILTRYTACRCGCHGQDPWHVPHFQRTIRDLVELDPAAIESEEGGWLILATGTARFPWGTENLVKRAYSVSGKIYRLGAHWELENLKR